MKTFLLVPILLLSACTSYNETFDCEPGIGVGCKSLSALNAMVDQGELPIVKEASEEATAPLMPYVPSKGGFRIWISPQVEEG